MLRPALHIKHATLCYEQQLVLADISLTIPNGTWVALLGASGVGKSSLLRLIAGIRQPAKIATYQLHSDTHSNVRQAIAYMGQTDLLLPWLSALDNVLLGYRLRGRTKGNIERAKELLKRVGLADKSHHFPQQLSGGMRQRVALARTLIEEKSIILMDEPFSALDAVTRHQMQELAVNLLRNKTVIFVTHDPTEALRLAHDIYLLHGTPAQLKHMASLPNNTPRPLTDPVLVAKQQHLYNELVTMLEERT